MKTFFKKRDYKFRKIKTREYGNRAFSFRRAEVDHNFLKYLRVVRAWARFKHNWTYADFEMISFLYSEHIFDEKKVYQYSQIFGFGKFRVDTMLEKGLINVFRKGQRGYSPMYELSASSKGIMRSIYKKLLGEEPINEFVSDIEMIKKNDSRFTERQYTRVIKRIKEEVKEQRLRPELL